MASSLTNWKKKSFLQVIPMATHWIRMWSYLQQKEQWEAMDSRCNRLETVARDFIQPVRLAVA
jgi:hypothetical protein